MTNNIKATSTTRKYQVIRKGGGVAGRMRAADAIAYVTIHGGSVYTTSTTLGRGGRMASRVDGRDQDGTVYLTDYFGPGKGYQHIYA